MHGGVETSALEIITKRLGKGQAKGPLPLFGKITKQEIESRLRSGAGGFQNRQQTVPKRREQRLEARGGLTRLIDRHHGIVRMLRPADTIRIGTGQLDGPGEMRRKDRE